jgi:competence protein ComEA
MNQVQHKWYRILAVICIGMAVCGGKIWLDASARPSIVYTSNNNPAESSEEATDTSSSILVSPTPGVTLEPQIETSVSSVIPIYLCGAVVCPGIYEIESGTYLYEVVRTAGGLRPDAAEEYLNLVYFISEAVSIYIPTDHEMLSFLEGESNTSSSYLRTGLLQGIWGVGNSQIDESGETKTTIAPALININTADQTELETLPGVGEVTAKAIISYREKSGGFAKTEDIMNVSGIKEGRFEAIRAFITV